MRRQRSGSGRRRDGDSVPTPLGFNAFTPESWNRQSGSRRSRSFRQLGRRSGRIPALPYPPPRCPYRIRKCNSNRSCEAQSITDRLCMYYGPEFVCRSVRSWCEKHHVLLRYIDAGRPMQNGHIESFNGRFRDECLNANWFPTLTNVRSELQAWRTDFNQSRPHSALGYLTPNEFAALSAQRQLQPTMMEKLL